MERNVKTNRNKHTSLSSSNSTLTPNFTTLDSFVSKFHPIDDELPSFREFLKSVRIYPLPPQQRHYVPLKLKYRKDYKKYLRLITITLLRSLSNNNVFINGVPGIAKRGSRRFREAGSVVGNGPKERVNGWGGCTETLTKASFFTMGEMLDYNWYKVFQLLGSMRMSELIINWKGFVKKNPISTLNATSGEFNAEFNADFNKVGEYVQIFGDGLTYIKKPAVLDSKLIFKSDVMNRNGRNLRFRHHRLIQLTADELLVEIFQANVKSRRYKRVKHVLESIIQNDVRCRYDILYRNLLIDRKEIDMSDILSNASELKDVVRFIFVILGKLFNLECWGGLENKKIIRKNIIRYLKLESISKMHIHDVCTGLQLVDFVWFGKNGKNGERSIHSKQDFEIRFQMMQRYMHWVFEHLVKKIIRNFFYVTESTQGEVLYFPRYIWHKIYNLWLEQYARENFIPTQLTGMEKYNYGRIKLIPKRNTFRVICVPAKRSVSSLGVKLDEKHREKQEIEFNVFRANELRPVRLVLLKKLNEKRQMDISYTTTAISNQQVADKILKFRSELLDKFGAIPPLYVVKFDMKECYDRINQKQLLSKILDLFSNDAFGTKYYFRSHVKLNLNLQIKSVKHVVETDFSQFDLFTGGVEHKELKELLMVIDKGKTIYLTRKNVLYHCVQQIFGAKCVIQDLQSGEMQWFRRRRGVFQGFCLLSIFCDIIYGALVAQEFRFLWESKDKMGKERLKGLFMLTRLVDDFLFISLSVDMYKQVVGVVQEEKRGNLRKYGAYVNHAKTVVVDDENRAETKTVQFVGLDIDIETLKFHKDYATAFGSGSGSGSGGGIVTSHYRTFQALLSYLKRSYTLRLYSYILKTECNDLFESVKCNVNNLLEFIMEIFKKSYQRIVQLDEFKMEKFIVFLSLLLDNTISKFVEANACADSVDWSMDWSMDGSVEELFESMQYCMLHVFKNSGLQFDDVVCWLHEFDNV